MYSKFIRNLKAEVIRAGYTPESFAAKMNVSKVTIYKYFNATTSPTIKFTYAACKVLDIDISKLI